MCLSFTNIEKNFRNKSIFLELSNKILKILNWDCLTDKKENDE